MNCPACKRPLRTKNTGAFTVDMCYGGCGGLWFDATELERASGRAAATLHTIWQPPHRVATTDGPRACPRCSNQSLDKKWYSDAKTVEIDQCPNCGGLWLDDGEFTRIRDELARANTAAPAWAGAMAAAIDYVQLETDPTAEPGGA